VVFVLIGGGSKIYDYHLLLLDNARPSMLSAPVILPIGVFQKDVLQLEVGMDEMHLVQERHGRK
jgi:hypothetical protein